MGLKSLVARQLAKFTERSISKWSKNAQGTQKKMLLYLLKNAGSTAFGTDHAFSSISNYEDFKKHVPLSDYEQLKPYIQRIKEGEADILWKGKPLYFAKSSGTTSGVKYIPITRESLPNHINRARDALLLYTHRSGNSKFFDGKLIFLSGSPEMESTNGIATGRLSGIVHNHVPSYLKKNQMPSYATNCIKDWEDKLEAIMDESIDKNLTLVSGIPPWVQMYFEHLIDRAGKPIIDIFPSLSLLVHGGVNFDPYRAQIKHMVGKTVDTLETYPASEGFIAFQDIPDRLQESESDRGLLLLLNSGIFYEFIKIEHLQDDDPERVMINDVELNTNYAIILNSNAGLWGYKIGDTVKFVSKNPYRIVVTGRTEHFISAFGEHVIAKEVEEAIVYALEKTKAEVIEFTVAPEINAKHELPYHEWFIEFAVLPHDMILFAKDVDDKLREQNIYYNDLVEGKVLQALKITPMQEHGFRRYMESKGKLGGQNKVTRLANDRSMADELQSWKR